MWKCNKSENEENLISLIRCVVENSWTIQWNISSNLSSTNEKNFKKQNYFTFLPLDRIELNSQKKRFTKQSQEDNGKWNLNNLYLINLKENPFFVALENQFSDFEAFQAVFKNILSLVKLKSLISTRSFWFLIPIELFFREISKELKS